MNPVPQRMIDAMQLRGLAPRTQASDVRAVQQLAQHDGKAPDRLTAEEIRQYFLYRCNEKPAARNPGPQALCGSKVFFEHPLTRDWPTRDFVRPPKKRKLPVVLSPAEVWRILDQIRLPHDRVGLSTMYACGLRLREGVHLQVDQIDRTRMQLHIQGGKGNTDRYVPLPPRTLTRLRAHWRTHRNPVWVVPAHGPAGCDRPTALAPMAARGLQHAFHAAVQELGLTKPATVHTLRPSWATLRLESGVNLRLMQVWLGHASPTTTAIATPLTRKADRRATAALDQLTAGMP